MLLPFATGKRKKQLIARSQYRWVNEKTMGGPYVLAWFHDEFPPIGPSSSSLLMIVHPPVPVPGSAKYVIPAYDGKWLLTFADELGVSRIVNTSAAG